MERPDQEAWTLLESGNPKKAEQVWRKLIVETAGADTRNTMRSNLGYALVAQEKFDEATQLYRDLWDETQSPIYLHQLAMVARERKDYFLAQYYLEQERTHIPPDETLYLAANLYEFGKICELREDYEVALQYALECQTLAFQTNDPVMKACAKRLLGDVWRHQDVIKAEAFYREAQALFSSVGDSIGVSEVEELVEELHEAAQ